MEKDTIKITPSLLRIFMQDRKNDTHKHDYGHALIVAGCETMPGAAVMATGAALHSGCGLVTLRSTRTAAQAAMTRYPSAMLSVDKDEVLASGIADTHRYSSIGIGPGLGRDSRTVEVLWQVLTEAKQHDIPMVLDADALNIISANEPQRDRIPEGSILTPHEGELRRLIPSEGEEAIMSFCKEHGVYLVRKGYHTRIYSPEGFVYENTTGNPGMAKGRSGDVLTGLLTGLLARGHSSLAAAMTGVWIHGYAGDRLTEERTAECWCAQELIDFLYLGFKEICGK